MIAFIGNHRGAHGVEPNRKGLPIAPPTWHVHVARRADPTRLSQRARQDAIRENKIRRVFAENFRICGVRKVWRQLRRDGEDIARCAMERLVRKMGLREVIRGKPVKVTISDKAALVLWIMSIVSSRRQSRTHCGSRTSRMSRHGPASSTSPS